MFDICLFDLDDALLQTEDLTVNPVCRGLCGPCANQGVAWCPTSTGSMVERYTFVDLRIRPPAHQCCPMPSLFLTPDEVYERYRGVISLGTLCNWRMMKIGSSFVKLGRAVLYPLAELENWIGRTS